MKLSVIVTTWGVERYAAACLDSIRRAAESAPFDVEIVEVSNGNGPGAARNEGLGRATGDYVWFVDGDDLVAPWTFEVVAPGADVVMFGHERFNDGEPPRFVLPASPAREFDLDVPSEAREAFRFARDGLLASTAWYRRAALGRLRFGGGRNFEDTSWGMRCFFRARTMSVVRACPYGYRQRAGSASSRGSARVRDVVRAMTGVVIGALGSRHVAFYFPRTVKYAGGMCVRTLFSGRSVPS